MTDAARYITFATVGNDLALSVSPPAGDPPVDPGAIASEVPNYTFDAVAHNQLPGSGRRAGWVYTPTGSTPDGVYYGDSIPDGSVCHFYADRMPVRVDLDIVGLTPGNPNRTGALAVNMQYSTASNDQVKVSDPRWPQSGAFTFRAVKASPQGRGHMFIMANDEDFDYNPGPTQAEVDQYHADLAAYSASGARNLPLKTNAEGLADRLQQSLHLRQGSCIYDLDAGFPWDRLNGTDNAVLVETLLRRHINALSFVESIESIALTFDDIRRRLTCNATVRTTLGESVPVVFNTLQ